MQELIMFRVSNKEAERAGGSERGEIVIPRVVRSNLEEPTDGRVQNLIGWISIHLGRRRISFGLFSSCHHAMFELHPGCDFECTREAILHVAHM